MKHRHPPIAIIGMASLFPKSPSLADYWRNIIDATDCISDVPDDHSWDPSEHYSADPNEKDKTWCTRGGFLDKYPFDPVEFGIPPNILESIDTTQLLSLIVARQALIDAGMDPKDAGWDRDRVACILGITGTQEMAVTLGSRLFGPVWRKALQRCGVDDRVADAVVKDIGAHLPTWTEQSFPGLLGNVVTGRISNRFDLGGTNAVVDAACASSLAAMQYALSELTSYRSDVVLTGGADCLNDTFMYQCFTRTPAFTKQGDAKPFDANSDGILIGEGIGMVACKRLEDAERDGDRIYAVIKGLGSSSDGRFKSIYAPNPEGQARCLRRAYEQADISTDTVELVEAHGTGTKAGDAAEIAGLKLVFGETERTDRWVQVGTVKSQIGHTKSTAGAAGLIKAALALHHRVLPPTAKVQSPNPKMGFEDSPFFLSPHARPWIRAKDHPRRAGVSAFGFGGTNYHCVLEEYGDDTAFTGMEAARGELFTLEADDVAGLKTALDALQQAPTFAHLARATQLGFTGKRAHTLAFATTAEDFADTVHSAEALLARGPGSRGDVHYGVASKPGKLGFLFPGQGSQYVEMGRDLAIRWPIVRAVLDQADEHFRVHGRSPLSQVSFPPPYGDAEADEARLRATEWAQPAIGAFSKGLLDLLTGFGLRPDAVAGHSYGELVALHAAGVLSADGLLTASRVRGECMSAGDADRGTMAAVSGPLAEIERVLAKLSGVILANRNHPEQGVISGSREAIDRAITALEAAELPCKRISVSAAFHSELVADAVQPFAAALAGIDFSAPALPVYSNTTAQPYPADPAAARRLLAEQIAQPVDWVGILEAMVADGVRTFVEVGPKGVLSTLVRQTFAGRPEITVISLDRHRHRVDGDLQLKAGLAQLLAAGVPVDLKPLLDQALPPEPPKPGSKATVGLNGANHKFESTKNPPITDAIRAARSISERAAQAAPVQPAPVQAAPKPSHPTPSKKIAPARPANRKTAMSDDLTALLESTRATLLAFQSTQERTAQVHSDFLKAHAEANASFHTLFQTHARLVELAATGQSSIPVARPTVRAALAPVAPAPVAAPVIQPPAAPAANTSSMQSMMSTEAAALVGSFLGQGTKTPATQRLPGLAGAVAVATDSPPLLDARIQPIGTVAPKAVPAKPVAPVSTGPSASSIDDAMFAAVAEKTGYPLDMLELEMDLEADLGIDSIKRVEILSAVQDKVPGLPELDNDRLSALRTLGEVTGYLAEIAGASATAAPSAPAPSAPVSTGVVSTSASGSAIDDAMFAAVAEKTGYPLDMLELGMDLEADLGIDSIKRVEILSAVQDKVPGLPELDNDRLSALRTLGEVTGYLAETAGLGGVAAKMQPPTMVRLQPGVALLRKEVRLVPCGPGIPAVPAGRIAVTADPAGKASRLVNALVSKGVDAFLFDPDWSADLTLSGVDGVIHFAAVGARGEDLQERVRGAFLLARAVGPVPYFATVSAMGGDFGLKKCKQPLQSALAGLSKTLSHEWEGRFLALDIDPNAAIDRVAEALVLDHGALEIGVQRSGITHLHNAVVPMPHSDDGPPCRSGDLVVVSGGARGVTAAVVTELARRYQPELLLLGRSAVADTDPQWALGIDDDGLQSAWIADARSRGIKPTPKEMNRALGKVRAAREVRQTLSEIRAAGSTVTYASVDIRDADAVEATVARIGKPVVGIIHGAGVLADKLVLAKTPEMFDRVFSTKVDGLDALLSTTDKHLRFAVFFASVAGRYGNIGQCDYAMANEVLTHTALQLAQRGVRAKSFDWGPWEAGMVTPALRKAFEERGLTVIPLREGSAFCCDELERGGPSVEVVVEGPRPDTGSLTRIVTLAEHPYLADHAIDGTPVVPVAMVLEWFADAARQTYPALHVCAVDSLQVLKGITLQDGRAELELSWKPTDAAPGEVALAMELRSPGRPHYRATVRLCFEAPVVRSFPGSNGLGKQRFTAETYGQWLFHGPALQGIDEVVGYSDHGIVAWLKSSKPGTLGLGGVEWTTDPLAVDSALQLMLLWVGETHGARALPCSIQSFKQYKPFAGRVACHLEMNRNNASSGRFEATFVDEAGQVVARIEAGEYAARR